MERIKTIEITVHEDIYVMFCTALEVTDNNINDFFDKCMWQYVVDVVEKAFPKSVSNNKAQASYGIHDKSYGMTNRKMEQWARKKDQGNHKIPGAFVEAEDKERYYGMANRKIGLWARRKDQGNHRILCAFNEAENKETGKAKLANMERIYYDYYDRSNLEQRVPDFRSNYAQMKIDSRKSHGKVFEDDGVNVTIWEEVYETFMKYKDSFKF